MLPITRRALLETLLATPPAQRLRQAFEDQARHIQPELIRLKVGIRGLDRRLNGIRIGQVSDVHIGQGFAPEYLERALTVFGRAPPDVLVCTGDLVDHPPWTRACMDLLAARRAPYGAFYSLGNHENFRDRDHIIRTVRGHGGVKLLLNEGMVVPVQGAALFMSGVDYPVEQNSTAARAPVNARCVELAHQRAEDADLRVCLAHHPDDFDEIARRGVELTLSGHTHGGKVPWADPLVRRAFRYYQGLYARDGSQLYVHSGTVGNHFPTPGGNPPEVAEITLVRV